MLKFILVFQWTSIWTKSNQNYWQRKNGKFTYYFLPCSEWDQFHKQTVFDVQFAYPDSEDEDEVVEEILNESSEPEKEEKDEGLNAKITEARRKEIITRTKYLEQKILDKKFELFSEWSERFYFVFAKSFQKFKNCLIELHLSDELLKKLNENLDCAIANLEENLNEIQKEYFTEEDEEEIQMETKKW